MTAVTEPASTRFSAGNSDAHAATATSSPPRAVPDIRKEVRFAVVLYGGVSLAVYIGGVVRELLSMVRATAVTHASGTEQFVEEDASESMAVYRKLAARLNNPDSGSKATDRVYTRFVIDVISGTSAGGLNGIYLAKALARGQTIEHLRGLWLAVGDIAGLLNRRAHPSSVLDGDTMLAALREAFVAMEQMTVGGGQPFVDSVECFATTTDLHGLPVAISLADKQIVEMGHKHVFRFAMQNDPGNGAPTASDFTNNDAALAFAARCTSAFPGAFAPAKLADVVGGVHDPRSLFPAYVGTSDNPNAPGNNSVFDAARHAFSDGGILNNKPFSHAIGALRSRGSGKPSERKLLYVEPSPDVAIDIEHARSRPSPDFSTPAFFDAVATANHLPSEQTIREDLEQVTERNRTIDRVNSLLADIPDEVLRYREQTQAILKARQARLTAEGKSAELEVVSRLLSIVDQTDWKRAATEFAAADVGEMMQLFGLGYGGYHRLKVAAVTDDLSSTISRLKGYAYRSAEFWGVRAMVRAWRDIAFAPYVRNLPPSEDARLKALLDALKDYPLVLARAKARKSENDFLLNWDLEYRLRRLDFLLNKADDLFCLDDRGAMFLRAFGITDANAWLTPARREQLRKIAEGAAKVHAALRRETEALADPTSPIGKQVVDAITAAPFTHNDLLALASSSDARHEAAGYQHVAKSFDAFAHVADVLCAEITKISIHASSEMGNLFSGQPMVRDRIAAPSELEPQDVLRFFYDNYEAVDRISFPVFYQSTVGRELDTVSVIRVSPSDAVAIVPAPEPGQRRRRLGGETLGHFGGFFARQWRASDFLWGQLDGAERIINAACKGASNISDAERDAFIREAHVAILSNDANVHEIELLAGIEGAQRGELRYAALKTRYEEIVKNPPELAPAIESTAKTALQILGNIVREYQVDKAAAPRGENEKGKAKGKIAIKAAAIAIYVAQSAFGDAGAAGSGRPDSTPNALLDEKARRMTSIANWLIFAGASAVVAGAWLAYVRCFASCMMVGPMRFVGGMGAIVGGTIAASVGIGLNVLRRWIPKVLAQLTPT